MSMHAEIVYKPNHATERMRNIIIEAAPDDKESMFMCEAMSMYAHLVETGREVVECVLVGKRRVQHYNGLIWK